MLKIIFQKSPSIVGTPGPITTPNTGIVTSDLDTSDPASVTASPTAWAAFSWQLHRLFYCKNDTSLSFLDTGPTRFNLPIQLVDFYIKQIAKPPC